MLMLGSNGFKQHSKGVTKPLEYTKFQTCALRQFLNRGSTAVTRLLLRTKPYHCKRVADSSLNLPRFCDWLSLQSAVFLVYRVTSGHCSLLKLPAGRIARALVDESGLSLVDIFPPWPFMLKYHLGDAQ
jgi:hypothetical protein